MVLKEFRITHSTLIEHYQFIEAHLEGIYAAISEKSFSDGLKEVEKDSLGGVVREIRELERDKKIRVLPRKNMPSCGRSLNAETSGVTAVISKWPSI
jgi:hypothetical protein